MSLTLDQFVQASAGHSTAEFHIANRNQAGQERLQVRGKVGRFVTRRAILTRDRSVAATAFKDAILDKITSHSAIMSNAGEGIQRQYQLGLTGIAKDLEASLDLHIRGERALTANDVMRLTARLKQKLSELESKSIDAHAAASVRNMTSTLPQAEARLAKVWSSLCPTKPLPATDDEMKQELVAIFTGHPEITAQQLARIKSRIDSARTAANTSVNEVAATICVAVGLENLHRDLLGYSIDLAADRTGQPIVTNAEIGRGTYGRVSTLNINGEEKVIKQYYGPSVYPIELDRNPRLGANEVKLNRGQEITAAFLKEEDKAYIVAPTHFIVREDLGPGIPVKQWLVEVREKEFRAWAKDQLIKNSTNANYHLTVVGQIQDRAEGVELGDALDHDGITPEMIQPIAYAYMNALMAMAERGFVHGDIKPKNTFYDPVSHRLKLIDTGGMTKVSKRAARLDSTLFDEGGYTAAYSLPSVDTGDKTGFEQDLFSVGTSILSLSLVQRGQDELFERVATMISNTVLAARGATLDVQDAFDDIDAYLDAHVLPIANDNERAAVGLMKEALQLARGGVVTDRRNYIPTLERLKNTFTAS